jgi:tRNA-dihydrouridine synthase C
VILQLLGSDLVALAENAAKVCELGAQAIDLNFGCPAKTVNLHDGGAALLKDPERVFQVTEAVRRAVPPAIPVTAKVRLGYSSDSQCVDIGVAAQAGGAHWLTVHGRTKEQGYRPPAHWDKIALIRQNLKIPVIANGEVWTAEDYRRCREVSGCNDVMIGRGLMAQPDLAWQILSGEEPLTFTELEPLLKQFILQSKLRQGEAYALARTKQILKLWSPTYPAARELFSHCKRAVSLPEIKSQIDQFFLSNEMRPSLERTEYPQWLASQ